jgi:hypothetical protein
VRLAAVILAGVLLAAAAPAEASRHTHLAVKRGAVAAKKRSAHRVSWRAPLARPALAPAPGAPPLDGPPSASAPAPSGEPTAPPSDAPPPAPACDSSPWLGVTAEDVDGFRLRLSRKCVPAGTVLFQFRNTDASEHNLFAEGVAPAAPSRRVVEDTEGETTVVASADLTAGQWRLYCSFPGHEAMSRLVDVTPAG